MAKKTLTKQDSDFRRLVLEHDGRVVDIAEFLGVLPSSVSRRLYTRKHVRWWLSFKREKAARVKKARIARQTAKEKARRHSRKQREAAQFGGSG